MYEVDDNGQTKYSSEQYFNCRARSKRLLCDVAVERDVLSIAKFLVCSQFAHSLHIRDSCHRNQLILSITILSAFTAGPTMQCV